MASSACAQIGALCAVALVLQSAGLVLFVLGFFPVKPALSGVSGAESFAPGCDVEFLGGNGGPGNTNDEPFVPAQYDRVVLMVVDGLPAEFVLGRDGSDQFSEAMPHTQSLRSKGAALGFHARAASPTVTMPRLKAMTSGAIAGFLDVAYNFNTQAMVEDTWLGQLAATGWRMVMLGDNTWLKLFPNLFARSDGVHSFFVKDTVEVDRNVTRHLDAELVAQDWDLLVLHYLGLDHVGHLGGRRSPLMASKLQEMDDVIGRIHQKLLSECSASGSKRTLLVVASDHGMTDSGNHGGATAQETDALALFVTGTACDSSAAPTFAKFVGQRRLMDGEAHQVDLVPTMALLLGIPIPKNSVGAVLVPLLSPLTPHQQLKELEANAWQLMRLLRARSPGSAALSDVCLAHQSGRVGGLDFTSRSDDKGLQKLCASFMSALELQRRWRTGEGHDTMMPSDQVETPSFETVKETYLKFLKPASEWLARGSTEKETRFLRSGSAMMLISALLLLRGLQNTCKFIREESATPGEEGEKLDLPVFVKVVALGGVCGHAASLGSSSFVEEEQFTWHFLVSTLLLALLRLSLQLWGEMKQDPALRASHVTARTVVGQVLQICLILSLGRILRSWHRSGVNWTHLPDVAKSLENGDPIVGILIRIFCICTVTLLCCKMVSRSMPKSLSAIVLVGLNLSAGLIIMYVAITFMSRHDTSQANLAARLVFWLLIITCSVAFFVTPWIICLEAVPSGTSKTSFGTQSLSEGNQLVLDVIADRTINAAGYVLVSCWCVVQLMLQQTVNACPLLLLLLQLLLATNFFRTLKPECQQWVPILTMYWLGASGHFGLGNSNTLATVDVAGAYIGLSSHSTLLSGILAFCITYGSPLLYMQASLLLKASSRSGAPGSTLTLSQQWLLESFALPIVLPSALNSVVLVTFTGVLLLMQDHLFVWSVFSPKYLYVCMNTLALYVGILIVLAVRAYFCLILFRRVRWTSTSAAAGSKCK